MGIRLSLVSVLMLFYSISSFGMGAKPVPHSVEVITNEKYEEVLKSKKPLFLAFNADWCPVCQKQNQVLGIVSTKYKEKAYFYTVDWDKKDKFKGPKTAQRTTIAFVKEGKIINELVGETEIEKIDSFIQTNLKK